MTRDDIENVLQAWVVNATGYTSSRVIWKNQDVPRPTEDFVELEMSDWTTMGAFDQVTEDVDTGRPTGQECVITVEGWREFTLMVQCYTHAETGAASAPAVLTKIQTHLALPSVRDGLLAANVTPSFKRGTVRNIPDVLGTSKWEARAILDVNFYTTDVATETTTYIENAAVRGQVHGTFNPATGAVDVTVTS